MTTVRITRTPRGAHQLHFNGFNYFKRDQRNDKTYWRCASPRCSATAITGQNHSGITRVLKEGDHSHAPAPHENDDDMDVDSALSESEDEQSRLGETTEESHDSSDGSSDEELEEETEAIEHEWEEWEEESEHGDEEDVEGAGNDGEDEEEGEDDAEGGEEEEDNSTWLDTLFAKQRKHRRSLRLLRDPDSDVREAVLKNAEKDLICFLNEICWNVLRRYFSLSKYELNIIKIFRLYVRTLADTEISWVDKKEFLIQHADDPFIAVLLNILAANQNFGV